MLDPTWTNDIVDLYQGDCREVLAALPARSVHCVVTSPPYWGLRDYGVGEMEIGLEATPELYVEHIVDVFREVWRVLRDDGTLWLNLGDSYAGSGKGQMGNGQHSPEHGTKQGTNAGSLSGGLPVSNAGLKPKDLVGIPWRVAFALQADGWYLRSDIIWQKPNPMPESVIDRPSKSHEYLFLLTKNEKYFYDIEAIKEPIAPSSIDRGPVDFGGAKGRAYQPEPSDPNYRNGKEQWGRRYDYRESSANGRNKRSVWTIVTQPYKGAHFATFPEKLVEPCILAGTSEKGVCHDCGAPWVRVIEKGELQEHPDRMNRNVRNVADFDGNDYAERESTLGLVRETKTIDWRATCDHHATIVPATVLDPFIGSGTTALVAQRLGRRSIGIDASAKYLNEIAIKRITGITLPMQFDA